MNYYDPSDPIDLLGLSPRSTNALKCGGYLQIGQLTGITWEQLSEIRNLGQKSIAEILKCTRSIQNQTIGASANAVLEHTLFRNAQGILCEDIPITELGLSVRAVNCLTSANISLASQLIGSTLDGLLAMRNMGKLTAQQILTKMQEISFIVAEENDRQEQSNCDGFCQAVIECLKKSLFFHAGTAYAELAEIYAELSVGIEGVSIDQLLGHAQTWKRIFETASIHDSIQALILKQCSATPYGITQRALCADLPKWADVCGAVDRLLEELMENNLIYITSEGKIACRYISVVDYANTLLQQKGNSFLLGRLHGLTLDEIGKAHDVTRERVRQVVQKQLEACPPVAEDYYAEVFQAYNWSKEDFLYAFDEPEETFRYLNLVYSNKEAKDLSALCLDSNFPLPFRKAAERSIYRNCIALGNEHIPINRAELIEFALRTYCTDEMAFDDFIELYGALLDEWGLSNNPKLMINSRTYEKSFPEKCNVLWKYKKRFRYYDAEQYDFTELFDTLALEQYHDIEYSTLKFFREFPELMRRYDIRDEYELHNLLKKMICTSERFPQISFNRMPNIEFGKANREEQVFDLLLQLAPISGNDFAAAYEEEYGVLARTVLANYVYCIDEYFFDGMYKIDLPALPPEQNKRIQELLTQDFYLTEDIIHIYLQEFPEGNRRYINPYTLKTLGFKVYNNYVIGSNFSSAIEYFRSLLLAPDMVDLREYSSRPMSIGVFSTELYRAKSELEIVEYAPLQFINIRRLEAANITKPMLRDYGHAAALAVEIGTYFTVKSLRAQGFTHSLDVLGFDDWFYASLLTEDKNRFAYTRMGGTKLFRRGSTDFSMKDFFAHIIESEISIDIEDLISMLDRKYGIKIERWKIIELVKGSSMYYNPIMEKIYIDYEAYFEEV